MILVGLGAAAHASAMSTCGAAVVPGDAPLTVSIACSGSSSAPGGPVSHFVMDVPDVPVTLVLRGMTLGSLRRGDVLEDRSVRYTADIALEPGLVYDIVAPEPLGRSLVVAGPDADLLKRCSTNPDTCLPAVDAVPEDLRPALRLNACVRRQDCGPARQDPMTDDVHALVALSCTAFNTLACDWMQALEPDGGWGVMQGEGVPGKGKLQATGVRYFALPDPTWHIGWVDAIPSEPRIAPDAFASPASTASGTEVRIDADGVRLVQGRKVVWTWEVQGIDEAALRFDGRQLVLKSGRVLVWVSFDGAGIAPIQGYPPRPAGTPTSLRVIRADGWPAAGTRVSAPCDADDRAFSCSGVVDLLGTVHLPGQHGSVVRVEGASVGGDRELVVVEHLPVRIPDTARVFDFEVDADGRVVRATEPLKPGDRVVQIGPLPVDGEPKGPVYIGPVPTELWAGLATSWGSVQVVRGGKRLTLE
ncbi:MAG: hypothetical protein R3F61_29445 [Myxococcota bacterium]